LWDFRDEHWHVLGMAALYDSHSCWFPV
jgi:hypothetical protein